MVSNFYIESFSVVCYGGFVAAWFLVINHFRADLACIELASQFDRFEAKK